MKASEKNGTSHTSTAQRKTDLDIFAGSNFRLSANYTNLLKTKDEFTAWVAEVDAAAPADKIQMMRSTFFCADFTPFWQCDPTSEEYQSLVFSLFEEMAGRPYSIEFEAEAAGNRNVALPFPYSTRAKRPIAENLMGVASLLNMLPVNPGTKVLDLGCGWANSSMTLARSGYDVTCVDIDPTCGEIIDFWRPRLCIDDNIRFVASSFDDIDKVIDGEKQFESIVFFKAFHHCANPLKLLETCHKLLKDGGYVVLGAEPITPNYFVPWGIRCDGTSAYAIAKHGWLELGFDREYFLKLASEAGFSLHEVHTSLEIPTMNGLVIKKES